MAVTITTPIATLHPVRNPMPIGFSADAAWATYDSYYVEIDVEIEEVWNSGTYVVQGINHRLYPDSAGNFMLSLHGLLKGKFGTDRPLWAANTSSECTGIIRRYRYILKDYGDGALLATFTSTDKMVIDSGLNYHEFQDLPTQIGVGKFLTHQPRIKYVRHWQPEFLYWPLRNTDTFRVSIDIIHEDSSITTWEPPGYSITGDYGQVAIFPVGHDQLNLEAQATDIIAWKVTVLNSSNQVYSEVMEYRIDPVMCDLDRYFFFQNAYGGWDVLRTTGLMTKRQLQVAGLTGSTPTGLTYDVRDGHLFKTDIEQYEVITQATGIGYNSEYIKWYKDFLSSRQVHRIGSVEPNLDGTQSSVLDMSQIIILTDSASLPADEEYEFAMEFQYREAFVNVGT